LYNGSPDEKTNGAYNKVSAINKTNNPTKITPSTKLSFADNIFRRSKRSGTNFKRGVGKNSDDESNADTNSTISSGNNNSNNNNNNLQIGRGGGGGYVVVSQKDRNKFCGSLPNNLDSDDVVDAVFPNYNQTGKFFFISSFCLVYQHVHINFGLIEFCSFIVDVFFVDVIFI
jgi:hypothetical protein